MTARTYDLILQVSSATNFAVSNIIVGNTSSTTATIVAVDTSNNLLKVRLANSIQEFTSTEKIHSNAILVTGTANGSLNTTSLPFQANLFSGNVTTAIATITGISPSSFIAEKNAFVQNPIVRLYTLYYPGEWYPPNSYGNPTGKGSGRAWPNDFPIKFAEIVGDFAQDINYNISYAGTSYIPFPTNITGFDQSSDGKIDELSLSVYNVDNLISALVENPYLSGNNISNSVMGYVNGELVHGLDPRTVNATAGSFGSGTTGYDAMTLARGQGLVYDENIVNYYGRANASFTRDTTLDVNGTWQAQKADTRDLSGGVVEIKTTFANFLDFWPEYSLVTYSNQNVVTMASILPYRVGDIVRLANTYYSNATITSIYENNLTLSSAIVPSLNTTAKSPSIYGMAFGGATNLYVTDNIYDNVTQYAITNYNPETATYVRTMDISDPSPTGLHFSNTGSIMYVAGSNRDNVLQYSLSTPYDISTATFTSNLYIGASETTIKDVAFDTFGSNLYIVGITSDTIYQYNLATAWNTATASLKRSLSVASTDNSPRGLMFNPTGTKMFMLGGTTKRIYEYALSEGWNVSTASLSANLYVGGYGSQINAIAAASLGRKLYIGVSDTNMIHKITLNVAWNLNTVTENIIPIGEPVYIENPDTDHDSYLKDVFKIDQLESLSDNIATFGLVSWLQYFKIVTPKRKYYKNTCQWIYMGDECQYPGPGDLEIPGTNPVLYSNTNPIAADNTVASSAAGDICSRSLAACSLRNNSIHFGAFPGTGRTVMQV